ncbi:MAG: DNA polymerase III subunit beta [Patescibacteria group bacterium]
MELTVLQENLLPSLTAAARVASAKSALPILENVLLAAEKGVLHLTATDLETGVKTKVGAKVVAEGSITVPARLLVSIVSNLPPGKITLKAQKDILTIEAESFSSKINGMPATEFPNLASPGKELFRIPAKDLEGAVTQVSFAAAQDESRPILTGILLRLGGGTLTLAGVDGFRLGEKKLPVAGEGLTAVVPARSLAEVSRLVKGEVEVGMADEGQLFFRSPDFLILSQMLEGEFPEYEQIIPANFETKIGFAKEEVLKAVQLASVFSDEGVTIIIFDYDPQKKVLEVSSQEAQQGEARQEVVIGGEGKKGRIAFNSRYVSDALNALFEDEIQLSLNSSLDPVLFTSPKDKNYRHVIMPVRLQE